MRRTRHSQDHRSLSALTLALAGAALLSACGGDAGGGGGVTGPVEPTPSCEAKVTVSLGVGQTMALTPEEAACFRLSPQSSARYVLAGFDARGVEAALAGPEPAPGASPTYWLGDGSTGGNAAASLASTGTRQAPGGDWTVVRSTAGESGNPFERARPWAEGERFPVKRLGSNEVTTARVARVYGGRYVFAVVESDAGERGGVLDDTREAMDFMLQGGIAVLDRAFGARNPATSAGSGQLLVMFGAWDPNNGTGGTFTEARPDGSGVHSVVWINLRTPGSGYEYQNTTAFRLKVLAHEMAHAWTARWAYDTQDGAQRKLAFGPAWASEGTADFVAMDVVRRYLRVDLDDNWDWRKRLKSINGETTFALEPADTRARLARGYFDASSFLRDLQVRLVRRGMTAEAALAEVAQGALEGWWGIDGAGVRRRGLTDRMRSQLGAAWEPTSAVLLWTLTQAVDDQTSNPELNNPVYASAADPDEAYAWKPAADDLHPGRAPSREVTSNAGGSFFVRVKDDGSGGTLSARASTTGARWMIVRAK